jgi:hypothetical protein
LGNGAAVSEWRDIKTAPKDGRAILIYQPNGHHFERRERHHEFDQNGRSVSFVEYDDNFFAIGYWRPWGGWGNRNQAEVHPTHWMPLPEPPQ